MEKLFRDENFWWGNIPTTDNKCEIPTKYLTYVTNHNNFFLKRRQKIKHLVRAHKESLCSKMTVITTKPNLVFTTSFCCFPFFFCGKFYIISFSILTLFWEFTFLVSASFMWTLLSCGSYWKQYYIMFNYVMWWYSVLFWFIH